MFRSIFDILNLLDSLIYLLLSSSAELSFILPDTDQSRVDIIGKRYKIIYCISITKTKIKIRKDKSIYFHISSCSGLFESIKCNAIALLKSSNTSTILTPIRIHDRVTATLDLTTELNIISRSNLIIAIHYLVGNRVSTCLFLLLRSPI